MYSIFYQFPGISKVHCLFTGRGCGQSALAGNISWHAKDEPAQVAAAREEILSICRIRGMTGWSECRQVHGVDIVFEPDPETDPLHPAALPDADGMMSSRSGIALLIKTADCQPLLLADTAGSHIMALHVGWRGNAARFPVLAVRDFCRRYGLSPRDVWAVRGPSLGPNHAEFVNFAREWGDSYAEWLDPATRCMNLWALTRAQLLEAGVPAAHIAGMPICTFENHHLWFSHRRNRQSGRQGALIWIAANSSEECL